MSWRVVLICTGVLDGQVKPGRERMSVGVLCHGRVMSDPRGSLSGRTFRNRTLREARFIGCDLSEVVVRGSDLAGMEIDSPWLLEEGGRLLVNGVEVVPLVDAELNRRFPGPRVSQGRGSRRPALRLGGVGGDLGGHA
jgi:hypothetical protein